MSPALRDAMLRLQVRADRIDPDALVRTFVDVGDLLTILSSPDNHVLFGRRGSGKTHALYYLREHVASKGDIAVLVDMRTIGSSGGLYADSTVSVGERGTRLLVDTLTAVHDALVDLVLRESENNAEVDALLPILDRLAIAITEVRVEGQREQEESVAASSEDEGEVTGGVSISIAGPSVSAGGRARSAEKLTREVRIRDAGVARHRIHFGALHRIFASLTDALDNRRVWVLLDEWTDVPQELQPLLADLIRRRSFRLATSR
jgi:hypothetical protein